MVEHVAQGTTVAENAIERVGLQAAQVADVEELSALHGIVEAKLVGVFPVKLQLNRGEIRHDDTAVEVR